MFSVEFSLGRRKKSGSPSSAGPAERLSFERGDAIGQQIDTKRRSVLGGWVRSMATLRRLNNIPSEAPQPDRS